MEGDDLGEAKVGMVRDWQWGSTAERVDTGR